MTWMPSTEVYYLITKKEVHKQFTNIYAQAALGRGPPSKLEKTEPRSGFGIKVLVMKLRCIGYSNWINTQIIWNDLTCCTVGFLIIYVACPAVIITDDRLCKYVHILVFLGHSYMCNLYACRERAKGTDYTYLPYELTSITNCGHIELHTIANNNISKYSL